MFYSAKTQWPIQGGPGPAFWRPGPPPSEHFCYYPPPPLNRVGLRRRPRKISATTSPPSLNRVGLRRRPRKISATTPPPLNHMGFRRPRKISATTPPTESRRLGTSNERGPLFRKILDLRLKQVVKRRVAKDVSIRTASNGNLRSF